MTTRDIIVRCEHGLHLRVASLIARLVRGQRAKVFLVKDDGHKANAGSVFDLVTLEAVPGTHLAITADGPDEAGVLEAVAGLFEHGDGI